MICLSPINLRAAQFKYRRDARARVFDSTIRNRIMISRCVGESAFSRTEKRAKQIRSEVLKEHRLIVSFYLVFLKHSDTCQTSLRFLWRERDKERIDLLFFFGVQLTLSRELTFVFLSSWFSVYFFLIPPVYVLHFFPLSPSLFRWKRKTKGK